VSVATSEPVVLHHGREGGVAGHHEARPSASTACWAAMPFSASAVPVAGLSQLRGEFANELCTHARLGQSEKCWHGLPTVSRCISEPSAGSRKPSVRRPGWPTISSLGYGERTERGSTEVRRSLGPLLSRFFKPSADGLEGNEGRVVIRTYTNPRCDELLRTPASGCDENGLETLGPQFSASAGTSSQSSASPKLRSFRSACSMAVRAVSASTVQGSSSDKMNPRSRSAQRTRPNLRGSSEARSASGSGRCWAARDETPG